MSLLARLRCYLTVGRVFAPACAVCSALLEPNERRRCWRCKRPICAAHTVAYFDGQWQLATCPDCIKALNP